MKTALISAAAILACLGCGRTRSEPRPDPVPEAAPPYAGYPRVAATAGLSCLLRESGDVECWGRDAEKYSLGGERLTDLSLGAIGACGIRQNASLICWPGERGTWGTVFDYPDGQFRKIAVSGFNACAVRTDGRLTCWGHPDHALNDAPDGRFADVALGTSGQACAVRVDGRLLCWGQNAGGQANPPDGTFVSVTAGGASSCALSTAGTVACWGAEASFHGLPGKRARAVAGGESGAGTCIITEQKELECVGDKIANPPRGPFEQVDIGDYHACGVRSDRTIVCWGSNSYGQSNAP